MKFLENAKLEALSSALSIEFGDGGQLDARVESYSCKMVQNDKRLWKEVIGSSGSASGPGLPTAPQKQNDLQPLSPPVRAEKWIFSNISPKFSALSAEFCVGEQNLLTVHRNRHRSDSTSGSDQDQSTYFCDVICRKTLFHLISVLNASFPDYEFSEAKGENFSKITMDSGIRTINNNLTSCTALFTDSQLNSGLWTVLNEEISLKECQIYSYNPDSTAVDPFTEDGCVWSFNYFFYNKRLKRVLFFVCRCLSGGVSSTNGNDDESSRTEPEGAIWALEEY